MKTTTIIILLIVSNIFALKGRLTFYNPTNERSQIIFIKGHIWNSNQLGTNTQNVIFNENKTVYFAPHETKTVTIKMRCIESYRPSPPNGTPISPTPMHIPMPAANNPSGSLDGQIKRAKRKSKRVNEVRGQVIR